jgi:transposase-like protein
LLPASFSAIGGVVLMALRSRDPQVRARRAQKQIEVAERSNQVGHLKLAGATIREISRTLGCSVGTAQQAWRKFQTSLVREGVDAERNVLAGRLERQYLDLQNRLRSGEPQAHLAAVRILELMATVLGLEAPKQVDLGVKNGPHFTRFEFVVEPLPDEPPPPLEGPQRRLLSPAESPEPMEEAS